MPRRGKRGLAFAFSMFSCTFFSLVLSPRSFVHLGSDFLFFTKKAFIATKCLSADNMKALFFFGH